MAVVGACRLVTSHFAIDEARRNLRVKRAGGRHDLDGLLASVGVAGDPGPGVLAWAGRYVGAKDAPILASAIGAHAGVLVTGDRRHFGELYGRGVHSVRDEPPRTALRVVLDAERAR